MEKVFEGYGIGIVKKDEKLFLRYDAGEIVSDYREIEISQEDAEKAQKSSQGAYEVIIAYQNKNIYGEKL